MSFEAQDLIQQAIERQDKIGIACSFGRASTLVLHMALKYNPDIKVFFNNTLCQPLETYEYRDLIVKKWNINLIELFPEKGCTFWTCVDKYGLPKCRKSGGKGGNSPRCCHYLKEKPAKKAYEKHRLKSLFTGIMAMENRNRKLLSLRYDNHDFFHEGIRLCGQRYYAATQNLWKYNPIMYWKDQDIKRYYKENNLPLNKFYTKWNGLYKRSGCKPCTAYMDWKKNLSISHPKLFQKLYSIQNPTQTYLLNSQQGGKTNERPK